MSTSQIQEKLLAVVEHGDSRLLKMLYAVAKEYTDENIILPGNPMTEKELKLRVRSAKARIHSGHFTTQEGLEKEMKEW